MQGNNTEGQNLKENTIYYCEYEANSWKRVNEGAVLIINKIHEEKKMIDGLSCRKFTVNGKDPFDIWIPSLLSNNFKVSAL